MSKIDAAALRELAELEQLAVEDDYPEPRNWTRPSWWRAEFDELIPMARYVVYSAAQGASQLRKHRSPGAEKADRERTKRKAAPAKVAHYQLQIPKYEARISELARALEDDDIRKVKRADGSPFSWMIEAEDELRRTEAHLRQARKSLRGWQLLLDTSAPPASAKPNA